MSDKCPKCGSDAWERDEVDVGVGTIAAGPYGCFDCGHVEQQIPIDEPDPPASAEGETR